LKWLAVSALAGTAAPMIMKTAAHNPNKALRMMSPL
jgi:hypothetical protein